MRALESIEIAYRDCKCYSCDEPIEKYTLSGTTWDCYFMHWTIRRLCKKCTAQQMRKLNAGYKEAKKMEKKLLPKRVMEKL